MSSRVFLNKMLVSFALYPILLISAGCSTYVRHQEDSIAKGKSWGVAIPENTSGKKNADLTFQEIFGVALANKGIASQPLRYSLGANELRDIDSVLQQAREKGVDYIVASTIIEWGYRDEGESRPEIGVIAQIIRTSDKKVVWQSAEARSAWMGGGVSSTAIRVAERMVASIKPR
jgi:hypothetical protein